MASMIDKAAGELVNLLVAEHGPYTYCRRESGYFVTLDGQFDMRDLARAAIAAMRDLPDFLADLGAQECKCPEDLFVQAWDLVHQEAMKD